MEELSLVALANLLEKRVGVTSQLTCPLHPTVIKGVFESRGPMPLT